MICWLPGDCGPFFVFFQRSKVTLPHASAPIPFILALNELLFTPFNLRALNDRRMQAREGGRGREHTHTLSRCSYRAPTMVLLKINRAKGTGIASQFFFVLRRGARYYRKFKQPTHRVEVKLSKENNGKNL